MRVVIYSGIPGSGKSTIVRAKHRDAIVCSADNYFTSKDGSYNFDPAKIGEAHAQCLKRFNAACSGDSLLDLVVDNTNTSVVEIAPYAALAQAYRYELQIITLLVAPEVAFARNVHGVSEETVRKMDAAIRSRVLPPWWPHEVREAA